MIEPKHLSLESTSADKLSLEALYQICPACFTEQRNEKTGELERKVNFDILRQLLGDRAVEDVAEAYEFTWVGKQEARREVARPIRKTLRPVREDSVDWDTTRNIYIEGDNLEALKLLQKSYLGKVKMIYIDPPYNTGNNFVYNDDFASTLKEEELAAGNIDELGNRYRRNTDTNGRFHSDWCSMIYSRLLMARNLLTEDGVIFISIDDNEQRNLKNICDEVFGEKNFVACINWRRSGGRQDSKYYAVIHEYILCYSKILDNFEAGQEIKSGDVYPKYDEQKHRYYKTQLLRKWGSNSLRENRPNLYYPIAGPDGSDVYPTIYVANEAGERATLNEIQGRWRWSASNLSNAMKEGRVEFKKNKWGKWEAYEKIFAPEEATTKKYTTWIDDLSNGTNDIKNLFNTVVFDYSKSPNMISRFIKMAGIEDDAIILDFFSGSATTAHAVMQMNAEDGGQRQFILVQLPEKTEEKSEAYKAGYKNICEIGKERIRRAGKKIKEELAAKRGEMGLLDWNKEKRELDTGFRVFRIDESNMKDVYFAPKDYDQSMLSTFTIDVKEDRSDLDLLFGCMLDWGLQLSLPMTEETIDGCTLYTVDDGFLVACFSQGVTHRVLEAIAGKSPQRIVFRDDCFQSDDSKINVYESLKQLLSWSDDAVMKNVRVI